MDRAIAVIAERQGGHISAPQLADLGLSRKAIEHRLARGLLIAVFQGIYAVGHRPTNPIDRARGALLAAGPTAVLSHGSAAAYWGIYTAWPDTLHVITTEDRRPRGLKVHRTTQRRSGTDVVTIDDGLRVTSRPLALLQIAPKLTRDRLIAIHTELRVHRQISPAQLADLVERFPRHPGAGCLKPLLGTPLGETRSPFEVEWIPFARRHRLPPHHLNVIVQGVRVDVLFLPDLLIVELDGWASHGTKHAFVNDRENPNEIYARTGIPTVRIARGPFRADPALQAERLRLILGRRRRELNSGV